MSTTTHVAPADSARVASIVDAIKAAYHPVRGAQSEYDEAAALAKTKGEARNPVRREQMLALGDMAARGAWTVKEVAKAVGDAGPALTNGQTDKAVQTFLGEARNAMHPNVAPIAREFAQLCDEMWGMEKLGEKDDPKPLAKCFVRQYHMLMTMFREAVKGNFLDTSEAVMEYAALNDPDLNPKKQYDRIQAALRELATIYVNFPCDELQTARNELAEISEDTLIKARAGALAPAAAPAAAPVTRPARPKPTLVTPTPVVAAPAPVVDDAKTEEDITTGVFDPLEEALAQAW